MASCNFNEISFNNYVDDINSNLYINCNDEDKTKFKSYTPHVPSFVTNLGEKASGIAPSEIGSEIPGASDGSCCYIITNISGEVVEPRSQDTKSTSSQYSKCSDIKFEISGVELSGSFMTINTITISNEDITSKVNVCGKYLPAGASALGSRIASIKDNITGGIDNVSGKITDLGTKGAKMGGLNGLALLILSGFLYLVIYVLFMIGPFMFWTKFAPNTKIEGPDDCNAGRTLLDRHFAHEPEELPYNWKKYNSCKSSNREPSLKLDKCMSGHNMMNKKISVGSTVFTKLDLLIKGFPYNMIDCERENFYRCFQGGPALIVSLISCSILAWYLSLSNVTVGNLLSFDIFETIEKLLPVLINCLFSAVITFFVLSVMMSKSGGTAMSKSLRNAIITFIATLLIGVLPSDISSGHLIVAVLAAIVIFITIANASSLPSMDGKNYSFSMAIVKVLYYIKKSFILGYRDGNISSSRNMTYYFKLLGNLPVPNWFWIIFGHLAMPILFILSVLLIIVSSVIGGFWGFFGWVEPYKNDSKCTTEHMNNAKNNSTSTAANFLNKVSKVKKMVDEKAKEINEKAKQINEDENIKNKRREAVKTGFSMGVTMGKEAKESIKNMRANDSKDKKASKDLCQRRTGFTLLQTGLLIIIMGICVLPLYAMLHLIFHGIKYFLVPLLYPKIFVDIISCNIKTLMFTFVISLLGIMWAQQDKSYYVPKEALIWMTVTFAVLTLFNILSG